MKLIYLNIGISSVIDSQVLSLLKYYVENKLVEDVTLLFGYKNKREKKIIEERNNNALKVLFFKVYPNYYIFNPLNHYSLNNVLKSNFGNFTNCYFHVRTELASFYLKNVTGNNNISVDQILPDIRGATFEEVQEFYGTKKVLSPLKLYNYKLALKGLSHYKNITVVSDALKKYILLKNNKIKKQNIFVTPCIAGSNFCYNPKARKELREEFKIASNEILIVFSSGGVANWQKNHMIIGFANMGCKVLNLSKKHIEHNNIINKFVNFSEVSSYLSASDAAFIWRDESIVNEVASPVKVSEYLACGLPIIHNNAIGLLKDLSKNYPSMFYAMNNFDDFKYSDILHLIQRIDKMEISSISKEIFGIEKIAAMYLNIYEK